MTLHERLYFGLILYSFRFFFIESVVTRGPCFRGRRGCLSSAE